MRARAATALRGCYNRRPAPEGGRVGDVKPAPDRSAVEAFILAGGQSRRMGRDKARLALDGVPLVLALARGIAPGVARVRVVCKPGTAFDDCGLECVHDREEETALVHGVRAALAVPGAAWRWLLACDMPGIDAGILAALWAAARAGGALGSAPRLPGASAPEPLPSLWHRDLLARVRPAWGHAARDWVREAELALWDVPPAWAARFANLNTPAQWRAYVERRPGGQS